MNETTNYELKIYGGTDIFNPLTVENENMQMIDEQMKKNEENGIGEATELKSNNVHAILRDTPDAAMFRFTATSDFTIGDSFTVDGLSVTAKMPNGTGLPDRAFVVNGTVLCSLVGQLLTIYTNGIMEAENAQKLDGHEATYFAEKTYTDEIKDIADSAATLATSAITKLEKINRILTIPEVTHDVSSGTIVEFGSLTLQPGTYLVEVMCRGTNKVSFSGLNANVPTSSSQAILNAITEVSPITGVSSSSARKSGNSHIYTFTEPTEVKLWAHSLETQSLRLSATIIGWVD